MIVLRRQENVELKDFEPFVCACCRGGGGSDGPWAADQHTGADGRSQAWPEVM